GHALHGVACAACRAGAWHGSVTPWPVLRTAEIGTTVGSVIDRGVEYVVSSIAYTWNCALRTRVPVAGSRATRDVKRMPAMWSALRVGSLLEPRRDQASVVKGVQNLGRGGNPVERGGHDGGHGARQRQVRLKEQEDGRDDGEQGHDRLVGGAEAALGGRVHGAPHFCSGAVRARTTSLAVSF